MSGIYIIKCKSTGKSYVGQSKNIGSRWGAHLSRLLEGVHVCKDLQSDFDKYGVGDFDFAVIETLQNPDMLDNAESMWIQKFGKAMLYNTVVPRIRPDDKADAIAKFISYIDERWAVPAGCSDNKPYRIFDKKDRDEIKWRALNSGMVDVFSSQMTFCRAINEVLTPLGYRAIDKCAIIDGKHRRYKLIMARDSIKTTA